MSLSHYSNLKKKETQNLFQNRATKYSLIALAFQSASFNAMAACELVKGTSAQTVTISIPATLSFPRDTPNQTVLYESAAVTPNGPSFQCTTDTKWGVKNSLGSDSPGSTLFPIGDTGISWQLVYGGDKIIPGDGGWGPVEAGTVYTFGITQAIRLVKTGELKSNSKISAGTIGRLKFDNLYPITLQVDKELKFVAQSCETPDVKVEMRQADVGNFSEVGDTSKPTTFHISLNNCPSGIKKVTYTLEPNPSAPAWNASLGIVELNKSSTAKGIALQILDKNQTPLELSKDHVFNDYSSTGGNFQIPLSARYYRTLPASSGGANDLGVMPGTANSEVSFVMSYL